MHIGAKLKFYCRNATAILFHEVTKLLSQAVGLRIAQLNRVIAFVYR